MKGDHTMDIDTHYQRYCRHCDRNDPLGAQRTLHFLAKASWDLALPIARRWSRTGCHEEIALDAVQQFVQIARKRKYRQIGEGLLTRIVIRRARDLHRRQQRNMDPQEYSDEILGGREYGYSNVEFAMALGAPGAGSDTLSRLNRALPHLSPRELSALIHQAEQEDPLLARHLAHCSVVAQRLAHDRRIAVQLERLRAGEIPPNTVKQWNFQLRRRIESADCHVN